jgi:signal peptidase I
MDLVKLGIAGLVITLPVILWDLFSKRPRGPEDTLSGWVQAAWMTFLVCGFGLMLKITGFSEVLLAASMLTGLVVLWDWLRRRHIPATAKPEPAWLEISKSFFPVILVVFLVRSFLFEPFKIPSGSMIPTLRVGDFILVNKYAYGIRWPVTNRVAIPVGTPERGDVMVFRYPEDPSTNYIKRIVGLPGDTVTYINKRLTINGQEIPMKPDGTFGDVEDALNFVRFDQYQEQLGTHLHSVIVVPDQQPVFVSQVRLFPGREGCEYSTQGFSCKVPPNSYFMMGDNRDHSSDSRYWGFVPEENIVGKAFVVWMNFQDLSRIGQRIH